MLGAVRARGSHSTEVPLMRALPHCPRALAAIAVAGAVATACSAPVANLPVLRRATIAAPIARLELAPAAITPSARTPVAVAHAATGPTILIDRAYDPKRVAAGAAATVAVTVQHALARAGFSTVARAEKRALDDATFIVSPTVRSLRVTAEGPRSTISCSITLRISPWSTVDQVERWEPYTTASATGAARAATSNARPQIALGIRDCLEGATHAAASREVIPFLRRMTLESKNISGSTSHAKL